MSDYESYSQGISVKAGAEEVLEVAEWTEMTCKLDSSALGDNFIGFDNSSTDMMKVDPGGTVGPHLVAPGTRIYVRTTATAVDAEWSFLFTDSPQDALVEAMETLTAVLMAMLPPGTVLPGLTRGRRGPTTRGPSKQKIRRRTVQYRELE